MSRPRTVRPTVWDVDGHEKVQLVQLSPDEARSLEGVAIEVGTPLLREEWSRLISGLDKGGRDNMMWRCAHCGQEGERSTRSADGRVHTACEGYERRRRELVMGNARRDFIMEGSKTMDQLRFESDQDQDTIFVTDGSVLRRCEEGALRCESGAAVVSSSTGETIHVMISGRPVEQHSYQAEMVALIALLYATKGEGTFRWVGDNESVQDLYKQVVEKRWQFDFRTLDNRTSRSLVRWLIKAVDAHEASGSRLVPVHQRSHLTRKTREARARDFRVLLSKADAAAEVARTTADWHINVSGCHPGVQEYELYG